MIFNEIYGTYYNTVAKILQEAVRGTLTAARLYSLIHSSAFGESVLTMPEGLAGEKWMLLRRDLSTPLTAEPELPLTLLEKRWLKAVLLDPRIRLFDPDLIDEKIRVPYKRRNILTATENRSINPCAPIVLQQFQSEKICHMGPCYRPILYLLLDMARKCHPVLIVFVC